MVKFIYIYISKSNIIFSKIHIIINLCDSAANFKKSYINNYCFKFTYFTKLLL